MTNLIYAFLNLRVSWVFLITITFRIITTTLPSVMTSLSSTTVDAPIIKGTTLLEETIFQSSQNPFLSSNLVSQSNILDHPIPPAMITSPTNIFMDNSNTIFQQQPQQMSIFNKQLISEDVITSNLDFRGGTGNGYQKLPTAQNDNDYGAEEELIAKLNRMHTQSPQLPRKTYTSLNTNSPHFLPPSSIAAHESPRLQSKFYHPQHSDYHNHYQQYQPLHAYKPLPQSTFSPVVKKRYGVDGNMVSEDIEFRILHGNTSPIVLQRFYHQQKQFRDQNQEELRAMQTAALPSATINNTNPFNSHIPIARNTNSPSLYNNRYVSSSPARNQYESNYYNASPQHHNNYIPRNGNGSIPYRQHLNNSPVHSSSQYQPQPQQLPMRYDRPPIPCPNSPQLDRLRVNLEKPNFYERHQLPVEVHLKETITSSSTSNGVTANEKSKGMLRKDKQ